MSSARNGWQVLGVAVKREPWIFALSTAGSVLFGALTVADAWVLGWATDQVLLPAFDTGTTTPKALVAIGALFIGVALLRAAAIVARRLGAGIMQYRMQAHSRRAVTRQYLDLPLSWHQKHPTGELLSTANSDVEASWSPIAPLPMAVGTVAMMVIAVAQMVATDLVMAVIGLTVFPLVIAANIVYQRISAPLFSQVQAQRGELSEIAHESFDGALVVKTLGREAAETARFAEKAHELRETATKAGKIRAAFDPMLESLPNLGVLGVLIVGAYRVQSGAAEAGDVVTIAYLLTIVAFPVRSIGWLLGEFPRSVAGFERLTKVLDEEARVSYGNQRLAASPTGAELALRGVAFAYPNQHQVFSGLSTTFLPGQTTAIVGPTASGKSTLAALMMRLAEPQAGSIQLDGVEIVDLAPGVLAEHAALVAQSAFLFDDTVRGNIVLDAGFDDAEVWETLKLVAADTFVRALPQGLDTHLGERGTTLSGGQRQRIALARALIRQPRLLILDDATSAVDPDVEARILASLRRVESNAEQTMVLIAYRLATIALADRVVFLDDGRVVDSGSHPELLDRNEDYAALVNAYAAKEVS